MNEEIKKALLDISMKKMQVENALKSYSIMMKITGEEYDEELNSLLDQKKALEELEERLKDKK